MNQQITMQQMESIKNEVNERISKHCGEEKQFALVLFGVMPEEHADFAEEHSIKDDDGLMTVIVRCSPDLFQRGIFTLADTIMAACEEERPELH